MQYKPSDAAKVCNTSVNTIRNWCRDYAPFLSPGARGNGGNRSLTDKDLNTLKYIAQLRAENLQQAAIAQRLQETSIGDVEMLTTLQGPAIASPDLAKVEELVPVATPEALQQAPASIVSPEYLMLIERRFEALEAATAAKRTGWERDAFMFAIGLGVGVLIFVGLLAGLALWGGG